MAYEFAVRAFHENRSLFELICRFNCRPALDIHPSHLEDQFSPKLLTLVQHSGRSSRRLSEWIISHWELSNHGFWDFAKPHRRFALLCPHRLSNLARFAGAAVCSGLIARVIDRGAQAALKESLGDNLYQFAVKRAPFLIGEPPATLIPADLSDEPTARIGRIGLQCLAVCYSGEPHELVRRLSLRLPRDCPPLCDEKLSSVERDGVAALLRRILLHELAPELKPCFK